MYIESIDALIKPFPHLEYCDKCNGEGWYIYKTNMPKVWKTKCPRCNGKGVRVEVS